MESVPARIEADGTWSTRRPDELHKNSVLAALSWSLTAATPLRCQCKRTFAAASARPVLERQNRTPECCPAINFRSDSCSDLHVLINLTHQYELTYHCLLVTLAYRYSSLLNVLTKVTNTRKFGGTQSHWRPRPLKFFRGTRRSPPPESPPVFTTKTATESSSLSLVSSLPYATRAGL